MGRMTYDASEDNTPSGETVDGIQERLFYAGYTMHKASLVPGNHDVRGIEDEALEEAKASLRQAIEGMVEKAIGLNVPILSTKPGFEEDVAVIANGVRDEIRLRAKEEISKLFGKE